MELCTPLVALQTSGATLQHIWARGVPALKLQGWDIENDTIDIEVVGLDQRLGISVARFELEDNNSVEKEIKVGAHDLRMDMKLRKGVVLPLGCRAGTGIGAGICTPPPPKFT